VQSFCREQDATEREREKSEGTVGSVREREALKPIQMPPDI